MPHLQRLHFLLHQSNQISFQIHLDPSWLFALSDKTKEGEELDKAMFLWTETTTYEY